MPPFPPAPPVLAYAVGVVLALAWNVLYGGRIARLRRAPRPLAALSGACGLLVVPAFVVYVSAGSLYGGRAVGAIAWLWPATTLLVLAQAAYATVRGYVTPFVGVPILLFDLVVTLVTASRWAMETTGGAPEPLVALSAAQSSVLAVLLGRLALASPFALGVPLVVPAFPARWRLTRTARALVALLAAFAFGVTLLEVPRAVGAVRSYARWSGERLSERPRGDFAVGVKLFTALDGPPPVLATRNDLALVDTLDPGAVHVVLRPGGMGFAALDSLARVLDPVRRDSTTLVVSMAFAADDAARRAADPAAFEARRLALVERVARALRPDLLLPVAEPYGAALHTVGRVAPEAWARHLTAATARVRRVNPNIRVAVAASSYDAADSTLWAWAASRPAPLDAVGFGVLPSLSGADGVDARLRAADRWMRAAAAAPDAPRRPKPHWVLDVHAYPVAHGEGSQAGTVWHTMAWATANPAFAGLVVAEPGDYTATTGLRAPNGRLRTAVETMRRGMRVLGETVVP